MLPHLVPDWTRILPRIPVQNGKSEQCQLPVLRQ